MRCTVQLFARYSELFGASEVALTLPDGAVVEDLIAALRHLPGGDLLPAHPFIAIDRARAVRQQRVAEQSEIALLPPFAGG